ncbi:amidase [Gloeocapsopsis crepidinum LEGE 06123]|uniref:Amidase n=1 Tax=Gloeocapsopsis crepidinum LEGE 06123 TaxID=588587 RepID=A0ABR9UQY9_9CHRO|nr:amidase [Gloeocapsopsis crepidinum]MBE9190475.1 amidase [Gloeocapsopsis crepidinum LEGE 06123]
MNDIVFLPAYQLAKMIRDRQVSSLEVLEAYLQQITQYNPTINAIITLDIENARQRAKTADEALAKGEIWGKLHGVPVTVKDCYETAGMRTTCGYKGLSDYIPQHNATVVSRICNAGAIILGKTNLALLASDMQTNSDFGRTNNPWNLAYTVGGSSGGSAAAVAAGLSPLDLCSGMGGSGRIPAHFCGVFGMKPTENRVSMAGAWATPLEGDRGLQYMYTAGAMTRSIADLKLWLSLVEGADGRFWQVPPVHSEAVDARSLKEYRIAWSDGFGDVPVSTEVRTAIEQLVNTIAGHGCIVEKANPSPFDFTGAIETCSELIGAWMSTRLIPQLPLLRDNVRRLISGGSVVKSSLRGTRFNLKQYASAMARRSSFTTQMEQFLCNYDAWICPTVAFPAFGHQPVGQPINIDGQQVNYLLGGVAYTAVFTLTGHPVVVIPIGQTVTLPIGIQMVTRRWHDMQLLHIAEKMTQVTETYQRPPGY